MIRQSSASSEINQVC